MRRLSGRSGVGPCAHQRRRGQPLLWRTHSKGPNKAALTQRQRRAPWGPGRVALLFSGGCMTLPTVLHGASRLIGRAHGPSGQAGAFGSRAVGPANAPRLLQAGRATGTNPPGGKLCSACSRPPAARTSTLYASTVHHCLVLHFASVETGVRTAPHHRTAGTEANE